MTDELYFNNAEGFTTTSYNQLQIGQVYRPFSEHLCLFAVQGYQKLASRTCLADFVNSIANLLVLSHSSQATSTHPHAEYWYIYPWIVPVLSKECHYKF